jgi:hypothetical protein
MAVPAVAGAVHGEMTLHAAGLLPRAQIRQVHQFARSFGAVKDLDAPVTRPVLERIDDAGAQGNKPDAAGDKGQVHAFVILHRKSVAVRAAHGEGVAGLEPMKGGGATAHLPDGEKGLVLGGAGRKRGWKFAHAEEGNLGELSGPEVLELRLRRRVLEAPVKRLHLRNVLHHPVQEWPALADKYFQCWAGSFLAVSGAARRIISTTLGMPISPWQTAAQRPQPTQAMASSRWMK